MRFLALLLDGKHGLAGIGLHSTSVLVLSGVSWEYRSLVSTILDDDDTDGRPFREEILSPHSNVTMHTISLLHTRSKRGEARMVVVVGAMGEQTLGKFSREENMK